MIRWERNYPGEASRCYDVVSPASGGFLLAGYQERSWQRGAANRRVVDLIRTDTEGDTIWRHQLFFEEFFTVYENDPMAFLDHEYLVIYNVIEVEDGFVLAGYAEEYDEEREGRDSIPAIDYLFWRNLFMLKIDVDGQMIWSSLIEDASNVIPHSIVECANGDILLACERGDTGLVLALSNEGELQWSGELNLGVVEGANTILDFGDGRFIVVAFTMLEGRDDTDIAVLGFNQEGEQLWANVIGSDLQEGPYDACINIDGQLAILGGVINDETDLDIWLLTADINGDSVESIFCPIEEDQFGFALRTLPDRSHLIGGSNGIRIENRLYRQPFACQITEGGEILWLENFEFDVGDRRSTTLGEFNSIVDAPGDTYLFAGWTEFDGLERPVLVALQNDTLEIRGMHEAEQLNETMFRIFPNPTNQGAIFSSSDYSKSIPLFQVFDLHGRLIWTSSATINGQSVYWNGFDQQNRSVPGGVYWVKANTGNEVRFKSITLFK